MLGLVGVPPTPAEQFEQIQHTESLPLDIFPFPFVGRCQVVMVDLLKADIDVGIESRV